MESSFNFHHRYLTVVALGTLLLLPGNGSELQQSSTTVRRRLKRGNRTEKDEEIEEGPIFVL